MSDTPGHVTPEAFWTGHVQELSRQPCGPRALVFACDHKRRFLVAIVSPAVGPVERVHTVVRILPTQVNAFEQTVFEALRAYDGD